MLPFLKKSNQPDPVGIKNIDTTINVTSVSVPKYRVKGNFVEYVIECTHNSNTWQVYRRYQQFKALHAQLTSLCPMGTPYHNEYGVIPVLCGSSWTEVTNQSPELVEKRRRYLEIYLQQLLVPKNLFYAAKTAVYAFLHDGEVPVYYKSRAHKPLPGLGTLAAIAEEDDDEDNAASNAPGGSNSPQSSAVLPRKQVVASNTLRLQQPESVLAATTPDMSAGGSKTHGERIAAAHASREANKPGAACKQLPGEATSPNKDGTQQGGAGAMGEDGAGRHNDTAHLPKEKCSNCGATTVITYELSQWDEYGRCESCNTFTVHLLIPAENDQPELDDDTEVDPPPAEADTTTDTTAVDEAPPTEGGEVEDVEESHPNADVTNCSGCNQPFSLFLRRHQCYQCNDIFCGYCCVPVEGDGREQQHDDGTAAATSEEAVKKEQRVAGKPLRQCMRCKQVEEHQRQLKASEADAVSSPQQAPLQPQMSGEISLSSSPDNLPQVSPQPPTKPHRVRTDATPEDFDLITTLGRGTFGKVMKVRYRQTDEVYAMKVLSKPIIHKRRMIDYIKEEKNILSLLRPHPFIVTLHFAFQTDYHLYFVMDFLAGGELYTHIYPHRNLSEKDARFYMAEVILAVEHLHKHDVVHRDIKPENVVLDAEGHVKLTDFGLARSNFSKMRRRSFVGSAEYLAPETIQGDVQTRALDWWSVGVMLFEMLHGSAPFTAGSNNEVYQSILHKKLELAKFSANAANLIARLLEKDPRHRLIDPEKIKAHPFFNGLDWDALYNFKIPPPFSPDLKVNDTKYFSKDFTSEWATLQKSGGCTRSTLETMIRRFSNFVLVNTDVDRDPSQPSVVGGTKKDAAMGKRGGGAKEGGGSSAVATSTPQHLDPHGAGFVLGANSPNSSNSPMMPPNLLPQLINPDSFIGVWRLMKVEMISQDAKVAYPWGSEVAGMLVYCGNGMYTMQLCPVKRRGFKYAANVSRITKEEMADAYLGYVALFGTYEVIPGRTYIVHHPAAALCPNLASAPQRSYFEMKETVLTLSTGTLAVEEGIMARTSIAWERVV